MDIDAYPYLHFGASQKKTCWNVIVLVRPRPK